jgi:hypothetical protein
VKVIQISNDKLAEAIVAVSNHEWQHAELHKRVMSLGQVLQDKPTFPTDPEDGRWPWFRIVGWKQYRIYLPRKQIEDGTPVCQTEIRTSEGDSNQSELASFIWLLMGRLTCP